MGYALSWDPALKWDLGGAGVRLVPWEARRGGSRMQGVREGGA